MKLKNYLTFPAFYKLTASIKQQDQIYDFN